MNWASHGREWLGGAKAKSEVLCEHDPPLTRSVVENLAVEVGVSGSWTRAGLMRGLMSGAEAGRGR